MRTLARQTAVHHDGERLKFERGTSEDELPDGVADKITNPGAWEGEAESELDDDQFAVPGGTGNHEPDLSEEEEFVAEDDEPDEFSNMTVPELRKVAHDRQIEDVSKLKNRDQLLAALREDAAV